MPRPRYLLKEGIYTKADVETLSGRTARDIMNSKYRYTLQYENLTEYQTSQIMGIVAGNTSVAFIVDDQIQENTTVWVEVTKREYGKNMRQAITLVLTEVS